MFERLKLEEGWTTLFLVWSLIAVTAIAIMAAELTNEGLDVLMGVGTAGVLAGLLLAKSKFSARTAHLYALVYGLALIAFAVGRLLPGDLPWRLRIFDLVQRQAVWMGKVVDGGISRDTIIFVLQTSAIFWLLGYTASWYTFRKPRVWRAVLPTGLVLLSVVYYYYGPKPLVLFLGAYALLALLYVARTHLVDQMRSWRSGSVRYEGDIHFDFLRASFIVGAVVLLLAGSMPALGANAGVTEAISGVDQPWREFQDSWTRLFSSLRSYGTGTNDAYNDSMVLGGPRSVGNALVMDVYVPRRLPNVYWEGVVLDTYSDDGVWSNNTERTLMHYPDEGPLEIPLTEGREAITQTVVNYVHNSSTIYSAPELLDTDRQLLVDMVYDEVGVISVNRVRSRYVLRQGDSYRAVSLVSNIDRTSLRNASTLYPEAIQEHYLQLPASITPETRDLAAELTAPFDNNFDKAMAVQDYLRDAIAYNDQISAPPEGVEPVHHILFDTQEGYCTYYASAMAVMLRAQGIPTRIVNGYAQGEFDEELNVYRVRASNAHTWVEVFFPEYGWIQFEPTSAIPVLERAEGAADAGGEDEEAASALERSRENLDREIQGLEPDNERLRDLLDEESGVENLQAQDRRGRLLRALGGGIILAFAGGLVLVANQFNRRVESDVERSYGRLSSWANWLGILFGPADTPYERADRLAQKVPEGRMPIRNLTHEFVLRHFSPRREGEDDFDPQAEWTVLRPLLLREAVKMRLERFRRRDRW